MESRLITLSDLLSNNSKTTNHVCDERNGTLCNGKFGDYDIDLGTGENNFQYKVKCQNFKPE